MEIFRFFNLCPFHTNSFGMGTERPAEKYIQDVQQHAIWADQHGLHGMVIYNFNTSLDPLLTAHIVLSTTRRLRPMIAVQPAHMHPFALMRAISTLTYLYQRAIDLNMVVGASSVDMHKIGDDLSEEERHERLREYIRAILLLSEGVTTFSGQYFHLNDLSIQPKLPPAYQPQIYIPGSSPASCQTIQAFAHSSPLMAKPFDIIKEEIARITCEREDLYHGMIIGIIARKTDEEAWGALRALPNQDRRTRLTNRMFIAKTSSHQHRTNLELADRQEVYDGQLWYGSAKIGIDAPKLVGSYTKVRAALQRYRELGITNFLLDLPDELTEYDHMLEVIQPLMSS